MKNVLTYVSLMLAVSCSKERIGQWETPELNHDTFGLHLEETKRDIDFIPFAAPTELLYEQSIAVILLDFDGGVVPAGSIWMNSALPYNHSGLTVMEQKQIFDSVTYDYSIFKNLIVTTNEETYFNAHPKKRTRLILTTTYSFHGIAGGVAYTGSIKWGNDTPCFVFTSLLQSIKHIQEAASHEIGHTLGLRHQAKYNNCTLTSEYDPGTPELGKIMGIGYNSKRVDWTVGPTPTACTDIQNDTLIIKQTIN